MEEHLKRCVPPLVPEKNSRSERPKRPRSQHRDLLLLFPCGLLTSRQSKYRQPCCYIIDSCKPRPGGHAWVAPRVCVFKCVLLNFMFLVSILTLLPVPLARCSDFARDAGCEVVFPCEGAVLELISRIGGILW